MSKLDEKVEKYTEAAKKLNLGLSADYIRKVTSKLGPSIYNPDAESVSCTDADELKRVRDNFLKKKLGLTKPADELEAAIQEVCEKMGKSNPRKYRALFYALLAKKFGKASIYD
jgi:hypothetical protein